MVCGACCSGSYVMFKSRLMCVCVCLYDRFTRHTAELVTIPAVECLNKVYLNFCIYEKKNHFYGDAFNLPGLEIFLATKWTVGRTSCRGYVRNCQLAAPTIVDRTYMMNFFPPSYRSIIQYTTTTAWYNEYNKRCIYYRVLLYSIAFS